MNLFDFSFLAIATLLTLIVAVYLFIRWRLNSYRFSLRTLLLTFTFACLALFVWVRFAMPIVAHRWAVQQLYRSGGAVLFREDYIPKSGNIYSDPGTINPWRDVSIVHIRNNGEAVAAAQQLKHLPEVDSLFLGAGVSDEGLNAICDSNSSAETLDFLNTPVTAVGLASLAKLKNLSTLFFNSCPIYDSDLASLKSLPTLRDLTLLEEAQQAKPNRFTDAGFEELGQMITLERLWLVNLKVSDAAAGHLRCLKNLKVLKLSRCRISDEAVADLRLVLPNCELKIFTDEPADAR